MNLNLLTAAKARVPCVPVLINMLSKRVRQLQSGFRPYVKPQKADEDFMDIALREVAEGALIAEIEFSGAAAEKE